MGLPTNPIICCGSGPSLTKVPFDSIGLPYAAVSTAIKYTPAPKHWILVDRVNNAHSRDPGKPQERGPGGAKALADKSIEKVIPESRRRFFDRKLNCTGIHRQKQTKFLGGSRDLLSHTRNRSMVLAMEWLSWRYDCIIFAGVDLQVNPFHDFVPTRKSRSRVNSRNHGLRMEFDLWGTFAAIAKEKGVLWLNWTPGSPLGDILEDFDDWRRRHQGSGGPDFLTAGLQPAECGQES